MKFRKGYIAVQDIAYEGQIVEDGTRVYWTKAGAQREADRITKSLHGRQDTGEVVEVSVPQ